MSKNEIISLIIVLAVISYATYKFITREYTETRSKYILDTIVEISATSKSKNVGNEIEAVFTYIQALEKKLNEYDPHSLIAQINDSSDDVFPMDPDLYNLLVVSDSLYKMSDGSFDPSIKPVWDLWGFNSENPKVPDSLLIKDTLKKVDFSRIRYNDKNLHKPAGMQLTFGSISKGYILDKAMANMKKRGLYRGFINSRSSMCFFGYKIAPLVYIQHPRKADDSIASFRINELSVGTSGDYQQFFEQDGIRYHHILNAKTGMPVEDIFSLTVVAKNTAFADGLSTALFTMDPNTALQIVSDLMQTNCIIYHELEDTIVSLKSEGIRDLEFSEKI